MRSTITNFSRGEFGPELFGRVDVPQYSAGAKKLRNFIIQRYGGAAFRPGMRFVGEVDDVSKNYRLLPFQYSLDQAYVISLGDSTMEALAGGGFIVEDDQKIMSVVQGNPTTLSIPYHGFALNDRIFIDGQSGMTALNGRFAKVIGVPDDSHVQIDVNSTLFTAQTGSTGTSHAAPPAPPPATEPPPATPAAPPPAPSTTTVSDETTSSGYLNYRYGYSSSYSSSY